MKLHFLLVPILLATGCTPNNQSIVKNSRVKPPPLKEDPALAKYRPITTSIEQLIADTTERQYSSFNGQYVIAGKYLVEVKFSDKAAEIDWRGFERIFYRNESCNYNNLICFSSPTGEFGRFYMNVENGKVIHEVITQPGDTTYYKVTRLTKNNTPRGEFSGQYSIIAPDMDSVTFSMEPVRPFQYEFQSSKGSRSIVYYKGRDQYGLMHYSNAIAMNSDHLSGLYKWNDDSNGTIVKLASH